MKYSEFLDHLKALPPSDKAVEAFLRLYFTENGISFSQADTTTPAPDPLPEGQSGWDTLNNAPITGLKHGSSLIHGQELLKYVHNESGADIANGTMVYFGTSNEDGHLTISPTRPELFARFGGMTTSPIADGEKGWVATYGTVHNVDITGLTVGQPLFCDPTVPGGVTNTDPEWPDHIIFVGGVTKDHGGNIGDIDINPYIVQREVPTPVVLTSYSAKPERDVTENIHGGFVAPAAWQGLSLATPVALTGVNGQGRGKLMFCVNAGTAVGTITVVGDTVDRNTGVITVDDSVDVPINGLTTDLSGADANGVSTYEFTGIYGTDKWFEGDVTVSCTDPTVTDVDMYHCSYEQFNDARIILLDTIDLNYYAYGNVPASAYLYTVVKTGASTFDLTIVAGSAVTGHVVDRMYRRRISDLGIQMTGVSDGVFVQVKWFGNNQFADAGIKVWANVIL